MHQAPTPTPSTPPSTPATPAPTLDAAVSEVRATLHRRAETVAHPRVLLREWAIEVRTCAFWQATCAECIGTFLFLAITTCAIVFTAPSQPTTDTIPRTALIATSFGLCIAVLVFALGSTSGGHLNPVASLAIALRGGISPPRFLAYIAAQCTGAVAGVGLTRSLNTVLFISAGGGANVIATHSLGITAATAAGAEVLASTIFAFVVLASSDMASFRETRAVAALNPLAIGLAVLLAHLALIPIDGCSINPARSFATALVTGTWDNAWVFLVCPCAGGVLAFLVFELLALGKRRQLGTGPRRSSDAGVRVEGVACGMAERQATPPRAPSMDMMT